MRLLHVTDAAAAGVLSAVTALARAQAEADAEVRLAYVPRPDSPPHSRIAEMAGERVSLERWHPSPAGAVRKLAMGLWVETGCGRPHDVIHLHSSRAGFLGRLAAAGRGTAARTVYSPHCFAFDRADFSAPTRTAFRGLEALALLGGRRLALVSRTEEDLAHRALPNARTAVLANAIDTSALPAWRGGSGSGVTIAHIGRLGSQKRPEAFSAITARLAAAGSVPVRTLWLGDGDRARVGPHVEVTGWLDRRALLARLAEVDLVLFTTAGEGMPISLLEAQAMGVPVVGADVTGVRDIVVDGVTGLLAQPPELHTAARRLVEDPGRRRRLGAAAARKVRECHDTADLADRSFAAYRSLGLLRGQ